MMIVSIHFVTKHLLLTICTVVLLLEETHAIREAYESYHKTRLPIELSIKNFTYDNLIMPFNMPRTPGSIQSRIIQEYIKDFYSFKLNNDWILETDSFEENEHNFTNLVFTLENPNYEINNDDDNRKYLLLAAHYDTLIPLSGFIGAMDSAASCAILMYVSKYIDSLWTTELRSSNGNDSTATNDNDGDDNNDSSSLNLHSRSLIDSGYGIKIVFFDGEEAIVKWTDTDSLYGARHLAQKWSENGTLEKLKLFVLMDLIGGQTDDRIKSFSITSYFQSSHEYYKLLSTVEDQYLDLIFEDQNIATAQTEEDDTDFSSKRNSNIERPSKELDPSNEVFILTSNIRIKDDHVPFHHHQVPILHLIPSPFPPHWHTMDDDFDHLDQEEINKWAVMMSEFTVLAAKMGND